MGEAEFQEGREPVGVEGEACLAQVTHHILHVLPDEMGQHEAVVQGSAPAHQIVAVGPLPEMSDQRPQQQHLHQAHARVGWHLESTQFQKSQPAALAVGRIKLVDAELRPVGIAGQVDQQIAQQAIHQPGLGNLALGHFLERDLQLVEAFDARLVCPWRLAGGADEEPREQVAHGRVVLPEGHQTAQQVGPAQKRAVGRRGAAQGHVIAAAGAGMTAVQHEFLTAQAGLMGLLVEDFGVADQLIPGFRRMDIDLDDAWIGGDVEAFEAPVVGRLIAFQAHRHPQLGGGGLDVGQQIQIVLQIVHWRQEYMQTAVTRLHTQGGAEHLHRLGRFGRVRLIHFGERLGCGRCPRTVVTRHLAHGIAQGRPSFKRAAFRDHRLAFTLLGAPGQALQGQAQAHGRVTGHQEHQVAAERPMHALPAYGAVIPAQGQAITHRHVKAARQHLAQAGMIRMLFAIQFQRIEVVGKGAFLPKVIEHILVAGLRMIRIDAQAPRQFTGKAQRIVHGAAIILAVFRQQLGSTPDRLPVRAPIQRQRPAWQFFAGIPFTLSDMKHAARCEAIPQPAQQAAGQLPLLGTQCRGVPLGRFHVVDRDERGFAAQRQAHIPGTELFIHCPPQQVNGLPLVLRVGFGDPRILVDALHLVGVVKLNLGFRVAPEIAGHRGGARRIRGAGQRNVSFAGEQA